MDLICQKLYSLKCFDDHVEYKYSFDKSYEIVRFMDENNINLIPSRVMIGNTIHERYISPDDELLKPVIEKYYNEVDDFFKENTVGNNGIKQFISERIYLKPKHFKSHINANKTFCIIQVPMRYIQRLAYTIPPYYDVTYFYSQRKFDFAMERFIFRLLEAKKYKSFGVFDFESNVLNRNDEHNALYELVILFNINVPELAKK